MKRNGNGEGTICKRSDGRWVAALQVGVKANGKSDIRSKYAKTEAEAKRKLKELKKIAYSEKPEGRKKQTVEQYMLEWFLRYKKNLKPASYDRQENTIRHQVIPFFGQYQIHSVIASDVKDFMNWIQHEKGYAYSTAKKAYDACNECLRQAVDDGVITRNPCNKQNKPKEADFIDFNNNEEDVHFLTDDEIDRFCKEAVRTYKNSKSVYRLGYAFILILNTGIRLGEALALRTQGDIDLENRRMMIDSNMSFVKNRKATKNENKYVFVEVLPKTKTSKRSLTLNGAACDAAKRLIELNNKNEFLLANSCGNLTLPRNFTNTFKSILKKAKIADYGVHALRHTYASALFRQGEDVKIISMLLGHASVKITQDTYIHLMDEQTSKAAIGIDFAKSVTADNLSHCGTMLYIPENDSIGIRMDNDQNFSRINNGASLEVFLCERWLPTRLEKINNNWYLFGLNGLPISGI